MVLHADRRGLDEQGAAAVLVGFVVAKTVGNAVVRNRIRRRLRHLVGSESLSALPHGTRIVIRALPAAATEPARLSQDFQRAWSRLLTSAAT